MVCQEGGQLVAFWPNIAAGHDRLESGHLQLEILALSSTGLSKLMCMCIV